MYFYHYSIMKLSEEIWILWSYGFSHAVVDFVCASTIFWLYARWVDTSAFFYLVLLYNCLAFGLQIFIGIIADKFHFSKSLAILWCIFLLWWPLFYFLNIPLVSIICLWIGNALFHIWGGITTLALDPWKSKYPWIFVAPWAIWLFLWTFFWWSDYYTWIEAVILLIICSLCMRLSSRKFHPYNLISTFSKSHSGRNWRLPLLIIISLLFISIIIRSFIWFLVKFSRKEWFLISFIFVLCIALWKTLGWVFADKYWWIKIWVSSLILSLACLLLWEFWMIFWMLWIFLFNITMPIAFSAMVKAEPEKSWTMFWLLCLALLIWAFPKLLNIDYMWNEIILLIYLILLSAFVLYVALRALNIKK